MRWVSLPAAAIRRPVTVSMLVITVLGLGIVALYKVPARVPSRDGFALHPLLHPLSRRDSGNRWRTRSLSRRKVNSGRCPTLSASPRVPMRMGAAYICTSTGDTDMGLATAEVRDRMERLRLRLPATVDQMVLGRFSSEAVPIMAFPLFSEKDPDDFAHLVRTFLVPRLMRISGVADVTVLQQAGGGCRRRVRPNRLGKPEPWNLPDRR